LQAESNEIFCGGVISKLLSSWSEWLVRGEEVVMLIIDEILECGRRNQELIIGNESILPIIKVVTDEVLTNEASEFEECPAQAEHIECLVQPHLVALLRIHELNNIETFWFCEPAGILTILAVVEFVLAFWGWRRDKRAQEIDFVLTNESSRSQSLSPLFTLLRCSLALANSFLSSGLFLGRQLLFSRDGAGLVPFLGENLLFLKLLLVLLRSLGDFLSLLRQLFLKFD